MKQTDLRHGFLLGRVLRMNVAGYVIDDSVSSAVAYN